MFIVFFFFCLPLSQTFQHFCHSGKINDFNLEEEAYGWTISQYPQLKKIVDKLTPFLRLYETVTDFLNQYEQWLHGPLSGVNPDKVRALENYFIVHNKVRVRVKITCIQGQCSFDFQYMTMLSIRQ